MTYNDIWYICMFCLFSIDVYFIHMLWYVCISVNISYWSSLSPNHHRKCEAWRFSPRLSTCPRFWIVLASSQAHTIPGRFPKFTALLVAARCCKWSVKSRGLLSVITYCISVYCMSYIPVWYITCRRNRWLLPKKPCKDLTQRRGWSLYNLFHVLAVRVGMQQFQRCPWYSKLI